MLDIRNSTIQVCGKGKGEKGNKFEVRGSDCVGVSI